MPDESPERVERRIREESIRSNRRRKFVDCLSKPDVEICAYLRLVHVGGILRAMIWVLATLRKLSWAGVPNDLRPIVWPLLLVRKSPLSF